METGLYALLHKMQNDFRTGPAHISLMMALFILNEERGRNDFISVKGNELRKYSKIGSKSAYHKHINDLQAFGYIRYLSNKGCRTGCRIKILYYL